jgi:hypothetical protein
MHRFSLRAAALRFVLCVSAVDPVEANLTAESQRTQSSNQYRCR